MIQEEVARQTKITNMVPMKKRHKYKSSEMGHAAVRCLYNGTSMCSLYRKTKLYYMYLEHRGEYSVATGINVDEGAKEDKASCKEIKKR